MSEILFPGDIVFIHSDGLIGWMIRQKTRRKGDKTAVNHVAMVVRSPDVIIDAQPPVVHKRPLAPEYYGEIMAVYRPKTIPTSVCDQIAQHALRYDGKHYGISKIILQLFGLSRFAFIDSLPICSYSVAVPYSEFGYSFGVKPRQATPEDIWDYVRAHPEKYACVRPLSIFEDPDYTEDPPLMMRTA